MNSHICLNRIAIAAGMAALALAIAGPTVAQDAMSSSAMMAGDQMMMRGKTIEITITNLLTGQPFSPSFFESRSLDASPLFKLGAKASDALVAVAEGGNIGMFSVGAAMNKDSLIGDAQLAIHALPGQSRTIYIHVDAKHPLIDAAWMLGNTYDGFSGFTGVDDPYEVPEHPELVVDTMVQTPEESLQAVLTRLVELGYLDDDRVMVEGDRLHSGLTDLRVHDTGHVVKEH